MDQAQVKYRKGMIRQVVQLNYRANILMSHSLETFNSHFLAMMRFDSVFERGSCKKNHNFILYYRMKACLLKYYTISAHIYLLSSGLNSSPEDITHSCVNSFWILNAPKSKTTDRFMLRTLHEISFKGMKVTY